MNDINIEIIRKFDYKTTNKHAQNISNLLFEAGELPAAVFMAIFALLEEKVGCVYIARINDSIAGYAVFANGEKADFKRLEYFAVEKSEQGKGIGTRIMKAFLKEILITPDAGLTVACKPKLQEFYLKSGFKSAGISDQGNDLILTYCNNPSIDPLKLRSLKYCQVKLSMDKIIAYTANIENDFSVNFIKQ